MFEKIFFKKIELWIVFLVVLLGLIGTVLFSFTVWYGTKGAERYQSLTKISIEIAKFPFTLIKVIDRTVLNTSDLKLEQRFGNDAGLKFFTDKDPSAGYVLLNRFDGDLRMSVSELIDVAAQEVVHRWTYDVDPIWAQSTLHSRLVHFRIDYRTARFRGLAFALKDGSIVAHGSASPLFKIDVCGQLQWIQDEDLFHHSTEMGPDGNLWIPVHLEPKHARLGSDDTFFDDGIAQVSPSGEVLYTKSVVEILDDNGLDALVFGLGQEKLNDPIHLNDIQPVMADGPFWKKGDLFLSARNLSLVLLYRPSENKVLWHKIGPWLSQHDVDIIDNERIGVFNNNSRRVFNYYKVDGSNDEVIYNFRTDTTETPFQAAFKHLQVRTFTSGSGDFVGEGPRELLVEETDHGRLIQFDRSGNVIWQYINRASDGRLYLLNWSRSISRDVGDSIRQAVEEARCDG